MIYKLHYWFFASGANVFSILIGVFIETYTDATPGELGTLLMSTLFLSSFFRPTICSLADRKQAHRNCVIICYIVVAISYLPFVIIPMLGESVYGKYPRICWYIFIVLKIIGDIAWGGACSISDSLAINYAKRIGTTFTVYRVWGTISWMFFGVVVGQVNEVETMPKYVPGFIILILAALIDSFFIWLWPKEYFEMSSPEQSTSESAKDEGAACDEKGNEEKGKKVKKENAFTKSLMPKEVVWAQAKQKLLRLVLCGHHSASKQTITASENVISVSKTVEDTGKREESDAMRQEAPVGTGDINKMTQLKVLLLLVQRDPRIIMYYIYFMFAGASMAALSYFFMSLSDICHNKGTCNFSQLAGLLQVSMSSLETLLFLYIARIIAKCGRVNVAAMAMLFVGLKFTFYATVWNDINPHYALLVEGIHGLVYGIYLTLMVETGHMFSSEVKYIIPELLERGIIPSDTNTEKLKYSLAATMQAIISSAFDGIGRGLGALAYGIILERANFQAIWLVIGVSGFTLFTVILIINIVSKLLGLRPGLDVRAEDEAKKRKLADIET